MSDESQPEIDLFLFLILKLVLNSEYLNSFTKQSSSDDIEIEPLKSCGVGLVAEEKQQNECHNEHTHVLQSIAN